LRLGVERVVVNSPHVATHQLDDALAGRIGAVRDLLAG